MNDAIDPVPALKQQLARAILDRLGARGQYRRARLLGVDQPRASDLERGRLERFSLQRLVRFAARIEGQVTVTVTWVGARMLIKPRADAAVQVNVVGRRPPCAP